MTKKAATRDKKKGRQIWKKRTVTSEIIKVVKKIFLVKKDVTSLKKVRDTCLVMKAETH